MSVKFMRNKKYKSFSEIIPYIAIVDNMIISDNPKRVTVILETYLSEFNDEAVMDSFHNKLMSIFCDFPSDVMISFYYCKTFFPADTIILNESKLDIVNYMEKNKYDYMHKHYTPEYMTYCSITLPVVESSNKLSDKIKKRKSSQEENIGFTDEEVRAYNTVRNVLNNRVKGLISTMGRTVIRLNDRQILAFLSKLINHKYLPAMTDFCDIIQSDWNFFVPGIFNKTNKGYLHYNDKFHAVLSLRANMKDSRLPTHTNAAMNRIFQTNDLSGIPFIVHHGIIIPEKSVGMSRAKRRLNMVANREGLASKLKFLEKTPEGLPPEKLREIITEAISTVEESSAKFMEQFFHVYLYARSLPVLERMYDTFDAVVRMQYKMKREKYNIKGAYFSIFPGNEDLEKIRVTLPSFNVADFMPIDLPPWPYHVKNNKWELYYYNEVNSFCKIDLFDSRCPNFNSIVAGASGSGKSFTEQDKLWQAMKYNPCVVIIDFGGDGMGSYMSFVQNLKGTYIQISLDKPHSINPFAGKFYVWEDEKNEGRPVIKVSESGEKTVEDGVIPDPLKQTSLIATLERMFLGKEKDKIVPPTVRAGVMEDIRQYYVDEDNNAGNTCNLSDFAEKYLKNNPKYTGDWNLYDRLADFIGKGAKRGSYAQFFEGTSVIENEDIICFDMAGLNGHDALKAVLIPALLNMIMQNILNNAAKRHRRKMLVLDEAWRELQGGDLAQFMEEMFRTIRKLNGGISIITQSINDLLGSSASAALISNTSYFWLIGGTHDADSLRQIKAQNRALTEYEINIIRNQQNKKEMFLLTPFFAGKLRFYPTGEFKMLATTSPDDRMVLDTVRKELGVEYTTPAVIERLKNHERFATAHHAD